MAEHNPQHGRRPHYHRGRRGPDRRGPDRRTTPRNSSPEPSREPAREGSVDVEQIMREIRSRIAQRHGIELSTQQIQELAARRLEAILEPRNIKPQLLEQLRRSASATEVPAAAPLETYEFEENTLFETHRGIVRFFRKLLNPILKLFFNPTPLVHALNTQVRINRELARREAERDQRQSEWNALHFDLLQRMVLETSRVSIEMQALGSRIESLAAKVDFNERRVRGLEGTVPTSSPRAHQQRHQDQPAVTTSSSPEPGPADAAPSAGDGNAEGTKRRRRRRRGRRSGSGIPDTSPAAGSTDTVEDDADAGDGSDAEEDEAAGNGIVDGLGVTARHAEPVPAPPAFEPPPSPEPARSELPPDLSAGAAAASPVTPTPAPMPTPPPDEPMPRDPVDRPDPGPVDR